MKQRRNIYGRLAVVVCILLMSASSGYAQIPEMINYQGYLADTEGAVTGPVKMEFRIYNDSGTELWNEIHETVMVSNGIYNVKLGSVNSLGGLLFNELYFLGVKVGDDLEMTPRQALTSMGYAFTANTALNVPNNVITSMMIQDGTISIEDVNFNYAGSTSKGGPATDLACEFCVSQTELDFVPLVRELDPQVDTLSAGKWCTSDGDVINCTENAPSASSWNLTGNAGTNPMDNFLGTIDNQPFEIRVANIRGLRVERHSTTPSLSPNIIGGDLSNGILPNVIGSTIGGGGEPSSENVITDNFSTIGGGKGNMAGNDSGTLIDASHATVGGGRDNKAHGVYATIGGGWGNMATANYATIAGGGRTTPDSMTGNLVTDDYGTIGGGGWNQAGDDAGTTTDAHFATVSGGLNNVARGNTSTVGGGYNNQANGALSSVGGGDSNAAVGYASAVCGGHNNEANADYAYIGGGGGNQVTAEYAAIGGGGETMPGDPLTANRVTGRYGTIGGGGGNRADIYATVGGGYNHEAIGIYSTVGGGMYNRATDDHTVISGGWYNKAGGDGATVGGGGGNEANGSISTIPGGFEARTSNYGQMAYASGSFMIFYPGDAQTSLYVLRNQTDNSTQKELFLDWAETERINIEEHRAMTFDILIIGRSTTSKSAGYRCSGVIENDGGTVTYLGIKQESLGADENVNWTVDCSSDDINDALVVKVKGDDTVIRWVATVRTAEVSWPAPTP